MWEKDENRLAVLELQHSGRLRRREGQQDVWTWLSQLPCTNTTRRRDELAIVSSRRSDLEEMLDRRWPPWRKTRDRLMSAGLPITHDGWRKLRDQDRATAARLLPRRLNAKTAAAQVGPHSKASLSGIRRTALANVEITHDGIVRLRPNKGLILKAGSTEVDGSALVKIAGEIILTERALLDGTKLAGTRPAAILLVENQGTYLDLRTPDANWMVVHVPGWNTVPATQLPVLLDQMDTVPLLHFGDLDPAGARIVNHLRTSFPKLQWAVPGFWKEYLPDHAQKGEWPSDLNLTAAPALVRELADARLWLEQESITLDDRLPRALAAALRNG